jgi:hypothetical protein
MNTYRNQEIIFIGSDRHPCRSLKGLAGTPAPTEKPASFDPGTRTVLRN